MKKTVIIVDHPHFDRSVVNRRWLEEVRKYPDEFVIHNLQSAYPRGNIDPSLEHSLIENNGSVVFQFPFYWYNCPPLMKQWFDVVLTGDWAFNKGHKLENRKIGIAVTCGSGEQDYSATGKHKRPVEDYLLPFTHAMEHCGTKVEGVYKFLGAGYAETATVENIAENARGYVEFLRTFKTED